MAHWLSLVVDGLNRQFLDDVSSAMFSLGAAGVAEEGDRGVEPPTRQTWDDGPPETPSSTVRLRAWFESPDANIRAAAEACLPHSVECRWETVPDEDWSTGWRVNFPVFRVGRLVVAPPWEEVPGSLILEPGQGFGTGQHATTRLVLERLVSLLDLEGDATPRCRVLDVGCGSGILSLAAAHLGADAYGIDNDPFAVEGARAEAARNHLSVPFDTTPLADVPGRWTIVLANLFADTIVDLADALIAKTEKHLILGGILADRERRVRDAFDSRLGQPDRSQNGEWVCLHYRVLDRIPS
jgi:ribosomal protein L11 methyltransferase